MIKFPCVKVLSVPHLTEWTIRSRWDSTLGHSFEGFVLNLSNNDVYYLTTRNVIFVDSIDKMLLVP